MKIIVFFSLILVTTALSASTFRFYKKSPLKHVIQFQDNVLLNRLITKKISISEFQNIISPDYKRALQESLDCPSLTDPNII